MKNNLIFNIPSYTNDHSTFPTPLSENYNYWTQLLNTFLPKADTIEIHCWDEEVDIIVELKAMPLGTFEMFNQENITIFRGKKTVILSNYLLNNYTNNMGKFKWFTVNLNSGKASIFHSGHWGTEFFVPNATDKDIDFIKSVTPLETSFQQY